MNRDYFEARQQILCLKYHPTSANNYRNLPKQQSDSPINEINSTLLLAQRLLKEYKLNQTKFQVRRVSVISHQEQSKLKTSTIDSKRFHMYSNKNSKLNSTANSSFYSKKSTDKLVSPIKPKTAVSRPRRVLPQKISMTPTDSLVPLVSAQSWCIINGKSGECVAGYNQFQSRQMASITKIMTCWLSLCLAKEMNFDLDNTIFTVPEKAERIGGTSAQLQSGDKLNIRDLLYGLMLPSGNDAAITLMHNFENANVINFVNVMNEYAANLGLEQTLYANPHGLFHEDNYSSAHDIGKLTYNALQHTQFASIVRTKIYFSEIEDKFGESKEVFWENTNKMLYNGFRGVKTGITKEAGPCVVEYFEENEHSYIIVLLNCRSVEQRWQDASKLLEWVKQ